jgi:hypothetical protein
VVEDVFQQGKREGEEMRHVSLRFRLHVSMGIGDTGPRLKSRAALTASCKLWPKDPRTLFVLRSPSIMIPKADILESQEPQAALGISRDIPEGYFSQPQPRSCADIKTHHAIMMGGQMMSRDRVTTRTWLLGQPVG